MFKSFTTRILVLLNYFLLFMCLLSVHDSIATSSSKNGLALTVGIVVLCVGVVLILVSSVAILKSSSRR